MNNGVRIVKAPKATARPDRFLRQPWRCGSLASTLPADVIHLHDPELLQIVPLLKRRSDRPRIIYDVHEDFSELLRIRSYLPGFLRTMMPPAVNLVEKSLARRVDAIIAVTPRLAARFRNRERETLYNFPSRRFYENALLTAKPVRARQYDLVHLGALSEARARFLAETLAILRRKRRSFTALITGTHPDRARLLERIKPEGCAIEGVIPYDGIALRLGEARIGLDIHPFPTSNLDVALPVKIFEYIASGCAVVTSSMPVLADLIDNDAQLSRSLRVIAGGEPERYAASILDALDRIDGGDDPGNRARIAVAERYVWEKEAEKMIDLYRRLACKHDD